MLYNGYEIKLCKDPVMFAIHSVGKGALPKLLQGFYTTHLAAQKQVDLYLSSKGRDKE